jgi:hypothetical protein
VTAATVTPLPKMLPEDGITHAREDWALAPCDGRWSLRKAAEKLLNDSLHDYWRSYANEIRRLAGDG